MTIPPDHAFIRRMHDKAVRRRRAVLVVLVAASLILLTAYFGESSDGRLHSAQRGALSVLSADPGGREPPPEAGPRPVRLVRGHARRQGPARQGDRRARRAAAPARRRPAAGGRGQSARGAQADRHDGGMTKYGPVDARVFTHSPNSWYQRVEISKGTDDGVQPGRPRDQRRRADRQGRGQHRRQLGRDADHRPELRDRGLRRPGARPGLDHARRRRARRSARDPGRRQRQGARGRPRLHPGTTATGDCSRSTRRRSRSARSAASTSARATSTAASTSSPPPTCSSSTWSRSSPSPTPTWAAADDHHQRLDRPPGPARPARGHRPAQRGLPDHDLRRPRGPRPAAGRRGGLHRGLDHRRVVRLLPRPVRRHQPVPAARRELARLHRRRLRCRTHPRAARPGARPRAGGGRRRRDGDLRHRLCAAAVPARRQGPGLGCCWCATS